VGIEDIKAKRAALQPPPGLEGSILVTGTLEEEVYTLLNEQVRRQTGRQGQARCSAHHPLVVHARHILTPHNTRAIPSPRHVMLQPVRPQPY
jgi:hypothetical protein